MFRKHIQAVMPAQNQAAIAYRDRLQRITATGIEMPATLRSFASGDGEPVLGGTSVRLDFTVEPPDAAAYEASIDQILPPAIIQTLAADQRLTVKVAEDDRQCLMLWNTPHAAGGADPETGRPVGASAPAPTVENRIARLEKLQALRASGALTDDEFATQKAKILQG